MSKLFEPTVLSLHDFNIRTISGPGHIVGNAEVRIARRQDTFASWHYTEGRSATALLGCLEPIGSVPAATAAIAATGQHSPIESACCVDLFPLTTDWT